MSNLGPREKLAVALEGWLGPRISEGFGLKWEDLDLDSRKVTFKQGFTGGRISRLKTEASRTDLSIPKDVIELLRTWRTLTPYTGPSDWVFASPYTKGKRPFWPGSFMSNHLQPVARALGLPHIGWHSFRHSLSAWAKAAHLPLDDVKTLLRQDTIEMAGQYGKVPFEEKAQLQRTVERYVRKKVKAQSKQVRRRGRTLPTAA